MNDLFELLLRSVFLDNLALSFFLGMCTFLAVLPDDAADDKKCTGW